MKKRNKESEIIPFDDPRITYYYEPWQRSQTADGPVIKTSKLNDYLDIWYVKLSKLEWYSEKAPENSIAGFEITGKDWTIQEMINLYSPKKDSKIQLIKRWDFPPDDYTIKLFNIGEKDPDAVGMDLVHAYFVVS